MRTIFILLLTSVMLVYASSCRKKEGCTDPTALNYDSKAKKDDGSCKYPTTPATQEPNIHIHSPVEHAEYHLGDTVHIEIEISHNTELHGYELYLHNTTTHDSVLSMDLHAHQTSYSIDTFWVNNVSVMSDMMLEVIVFKDHSGNKKTATVHFHCHNM